MSIQHQLMEKLHRKVALEQLVGSTCRARLLEHFTSQPDRAFGPRQAARLANVDYKAAHGEIRRLAELGLLVAVATGDSVQHRWNREHPAARDIEGLVSKMSELGPIRVLREELTAVKWIQRAILFGSLARGNYRGTSDVDLILVGGGTVEKFLPIAERLERRLARRVDFHLYSAAELAEQARDPTSLVARVAHGDHVVIKDSLAER
jgi:predicted nucleotidyltransferase